MNRQIYFHVQPLDEAHFLECVHLVISHDLSWACIGAKLASKGSLKLGILCFSKSFLHNQNYSQPTKASLCRFVELLPPFPPQHHLLHINLSMILWNVKLSTLLASYAM